MTDIINFKDLINIELCLNNKPTLKQRIREYNKENSYWRSQSINMLIESLANQKKEKKLKQLDEIKKKYQALSNEYQENKSENSIPLK